MKQYFVVLALLGISCLQAMDEPQTEKKVKKVQQEWRLPIEKVELYAEKGNEGYKLFFKDGRQICVWKEYYGGASERYKGLTIRPRCALPNGIVLKETQVPLEQTTFGSARDWFISLRDLYKQQGK